MDPLSILTILANAGVLCRAGYWVFNELSKKPEIAASRPSRPTQRKPSYPNCGLSSPPQDRVGISQRLPFDPPKVGLVHPDQGSSDSVRRMPFAPSPTDGRKLSADRRKFVPRPFDGNLESVDAAFKREYVSYTRIKTYAQCPHKFRLRYLNRRPEEVSSKFKDAGDNFHRQCELFFGMHQDATIDSLRQSPELAKLDPRLRGVIEGIPAKSRVRSSEHEFLFNYGDIPFYGIVDLVVLDDDGITRLIDFKSGSLSHPDLEQLELYCLPLLIEAPEARVRLSFLLVDQHEIITWEVGPENRGEVFANLVRCVEQMRGDRVLPPFVSSKCKFCDFARVCEHRSKPSSPAKVAFLTPARSGAAARTKRTRSS